MELRVRAEAQHRRRENDHVVEAHALHGAPGEHNVAVDVRLLDGFIQGRVVGDATADILVGQSAIADQAVGIGLLRRNGLGANHRIFDILANLAPVDGLDVVGINIEDHVVLVIPLFRLLSGVRQDLARVRVDVDPLDRDLMDLFGSLSHLPPPHMGPRTPTPPRPSESAGHRRSFSPLGDRTPSARGSPPS